MARARSFDSNGMKKGAWSEDEDNKLRAFVLTYGHSNWRLLPNYAGLKRCGKSCRLRWMNHLKPGVKRGSFSKEEEDLIIKLHAKIGNKWSAIAAELPGRTDNDIKNFWNARIARRRKPNSLPTQPSSYSSSSMDDQLLEMPPNNQTDSLIKNIDESTMTFDTNSLLLPATQAQSQPQMDLWGDANCSQNYAQLLEEEFCYDPQLYYNEFF